MAGSYVSFPKRKKITVLFWSLFKLSIQCKGLVEATKIGEESKLFNLLVKSRIESINNNAIGAKVFLDNKIAPDGTYEYLNPSRKIFVKNGRITIGNSKPFDL